MKLTDKNIDSLRSLSEIFTSSNFNNIVRRGDYKLTANKIKKHYFSELKNATYKKVIENLYKQLQATYRSEYFYKNNLLNKYLLKQYSLSTTSVLNEFRIGNSIADFVLLNGTVRIFEIKTDLDGLDKLEKQINDYKQFADLVYIVTSSKYIDKVLIDYANSTVGIIEFTQRNTLKEHKSAENNSQYFKHQTIFKILRKQEYLNIVENYYGSIPDVPNTKIFRACLELISKIKTTEFQKLALNELKKRKIKCPDLLESEKTPFELKHICYTLDFSEAEYSSLHTFLHKFI